MRGATVVPADDVVRVLREAAEPHARRAVRTFTSDDEFTQMDPAADAGNAVELLAKATWSESGASASSVAGTSCHPWIATLYAPT